MHTLHDPIFDSIPFDFLTPFWETSPEEWLKYLDMNKTPIFVKKKIMTPLKKKLLKLFKLVYL